MDSDRIQTDMFIIPLLDRFLVYAPLRRTAFIANATAVNLLARLRQAPTVATNEEETSFLHFCRQIHLTGKDGDTPPGDPQGAGLPSQWHSLLRLLSKQTSSPELARVSLFSLPRSRIGKGLQADGYYGRGD